MNNYTHDRFTEFANRVIDMLSHVKRIDGKTGEVFEELWDDEDIFFEDYDIENVENAITVDYEYDYDDDVDLDGCINEDGETLADVYGFKIHNGRLYVYSSFYAGHGTSTSDWGLLSYGSIQRPIALERAILGTLQRTLVRRWRWDLGLYICDTLYDIERGCSKIKRTRALAVPKGCIVPLGNGVPLLNGKVAIALRGEYSWGHISICTKTNEDISAEEVIAISPDDPSETITDFIEKVICMLENRQTQWEVIVPDKDTDIGYLNLECYSLQDQEYYYDVLTIKDKRTVINDGDLEFISNLFRSIRVPHGFIIPPNAGLDPSVIVIEE